MPWRSINVFFSHRRKCEVEVRSITFESIRRHGVGPSPWFDRLVTVFNAMDAGYEKTAGNYGFVCQGCEDNCCQSRFYHHTLLEYMSIYRGFLGLTGQERQAVEVRAAEYCRQHAEADAAGTAVKPWCPLNANGRCLVYDVRPMICRLHGLPHVLCQPGGKVVQGPGCDTFQSHQPPGNSSFLDRTPFYKAMAGLEKEFRTELEVNVRIKQTIAEMIMSFLPGHSERMQGENR